MARFTLCAPRTRKNNPFYLVRGTANGRDFEVSSKTSNKAEAREFAENFCRNAEESFAEGRSLADRVAQLLTISLSGIIDGNNPQVKCGIYFLMNGPEILYVGQSHDIKARIKAHREKKFGERIPFTNTSAIACSLEDLNLLEAAYIHRYRPKFNRNINRPSLKRPSEL
jgi:hypothetical protein